MNVRQSGGRTTAAVDPCLSRLSPKPQPGPSSTGPGPGASFAQPSRIRLRPFFMDLSREMFLVGRGSLEDQKYITTVYKTL